jgi:hypothetical protein
MLAPGMKLIQTGWARLCSSPSALVQENVSGLKAGHATHTNGNLWLELPKYPECPNTKVLVLFLTSSSNLF